MGQLTELHIEGFRGIARADLTALTDVNVLIGRNGVGKTSIVEALVLAWRDVWNADPVHGADLDQFWRDSRGGARAHPAKIVLVGTHGSGEWSSKHGGRALAHSQISTPFQDWCGRCTWFGHRDGFDPRLEQTLWKRVLETRGDKILSAAAASVYGLPLEGIQLVDGKAIALLPDRSQDLDVLGDGVRVALRMLMALSVLHDGVLCVEEPECHQHPAALPALARALVDGGKRSSVQIIATTHSLEVVRALAAACEDAKRGFAVYHLERDAAGVVAPTRLEAGTVAHLDETGVDPRRLDEYARG